MNLKRNLIDLSILLYKISPVFKGTNLYSLEIHIESCFFFDILEKLINKQAINIELKDIYTY